MDEEPFKAEIPIMKVIFNFVFASLHLLPSGEWTWVCGFSFTSISLDKSLLKILMRFIYLFVEKKIAMFFCLKMKKIK